MGTIFRRSWFFTSVFALLLLNASRGTTQTIFFPDFSSTAGLQLNGNTASVANRLRLTPAQYFVRGSAYTVAPQSVQNGFDTRFQFQINGMGGLFNDAEGNPGGDGIAFVIQNSSNATLGDYGGQMGYGGIPNSLAIEFDMWFNPPSEHNDPNGNHISVHTRRLLPNSADEAYSLGYTTAIPNMSDGNVHNAEIRYDPGTLQIFLDNDVTPRLTIPVNLATTLNLSNGTAFVGFSAATYNAWENHDLLSWTYTAVPEPSSLVLLGISSISLFVYTWRRMFSANDCAA